MSRPRSLRRDLSLGIAFGIAVLWIIALFLAGAVLRHELDEVSDSALQEAAERILSIAVVEVTNSEDQAARRISPIGQHDEYLTYAVYDSEGQVLLYSHEAHRKLFSGARRLGFWNRHGYRLYGLEAVSGTYSIAVAEPIKHRRETLIHTMQALALPMTALLPLSVLWVLWLTRNRLRPMRRLSDALHARDESDLAPITTDELQAEFLPLGTSINVLMERMSRALDAERTFTSSAAHEMRTPIAAALAQAQRLSRELEEKPEQARAQALAAELKRLARLAEKLLQLARAEGAGVLRETRSDLVPVLALTLDDFRREGAGKRLEAELPEEAPSYIDPDAFGILARNLIENALLHSPIGTPVRLVLSPDGVLTVSNESETIPSERLEQLTRRFERAGTGGPGSGLGLAIAESIARAAKGQLDLISPIPGKEGGFRAIFSPRRQTSG